MTGIVAEAPQAYNEDDIRYKLIPTIRKFHECGAQKRCIVGPVGSGKTTGATWEICYYLPYFFFNTYNIKKTRWVVVRNTSVELRDTTLKTVQEWFDFGTYKVQAMVLLLNYPNGVEVEIMFRACDNEKHVRQFKSLEVTGYWIDESIEVAESTKLMLKNRIGRYPRKSPAKFGIETTNPPDIEHPTYSQYAWDTPPPGPVPAGAPLEKHVGFWQPPYENEENLPVGYYEDLKRDYANNLDWLEMYVEGKPGQLIRGKLVYDNFDRKYHCAEKPLIWSGQDLYRGWDNSGNTPACIVVCPVTIGRLHIFREFVTVRENAVDFANRVIEECNTSFPNAKFVDYGDPAGEATYSTRDGTFTSNAQLMSDECGIDVISGEQNFKKRINAVDQALLKRDGVLIDPGCIRLINGFLGGYHYPELTNMPGHYKKDPQKNKYSHCFVGDTFVDTPSGAVRIDALRVGDEVTTPKGSKVITATMSHTSSKLVRLTLSNGVVLTCTEDHRLYTNAGQVRADALQYSHVLLTIKEGDQLWDAQQNTRFRSLKELGTIRRARAIIKHVIKRVRTIPDICIGRCGRLSTVKYLTDIASTIKTMTDRITTFQTSKLCHRENMQYTISTGESTATLLLTETTFSQILCLPPLRGIKVELKKCENVIVKSGLNLGKVERVSNILVSCVGRGMKLLEGLKRKAFALPHVRAKHVADRAWMILRFRVLSVARSLLRTSMPESEHVQESVGEYSDVRLLKRERLSSSQKVYDLTVKDAHCFYVEGVLVSNCHDALQYVCTMLYISAAPLISSSDVNPDYDVEPTY